MRIFTMTCQNEAGRDVLHCRVADDKTVRVAYSAEDLDRPGRFIVFSSTDEMFATHPDWTPDA